MGKTQIGGQDGGHTLDDVWINYSGMFELTDNDRYQFDMFDIRIYRMLYLHFGFMEFCTSRCRCTYPVISNMSWHSCCSSRVNWGPELLSPALEKV